MAVPEVMAAVAVAVPHHQAPTEVLAVMVLQLFAFISED
jgi:hypothetical protein